MHKTLLTLAVAYTMVAVAWAQSPVPNAPSPGPDPQYINNIILELQAQRGTALDAAATAKAQLTIAQGKLEAALKELADLKAKATPPAPETK